MFLAGNAKRFPKISGDNPRPEKHFAGPEKNTRNVFGPKKFSGL